jgi:hypothetical protein
MDETWDVALALRGGLPTYRVETRKAKDLLIHLPIEDHGDTTDGVSGDRTMHALLRDRSVRVR